MLSMASPITHFNHQTPNHYMKQINDDPNFECGTCKAPGTGRAYKCQSCTFALHCSCESNKPAITFFMHPEHGMTSLTEHSHLAMNPVTCDLCGERVIGVWYRCAICNFDVHPVCAHIPQFVKALVHLNGAH